MKKRVGDKFLGMFVWQSILNVARVIIREGREELNVARVIIRKGREEDQ